MGQFEEVIRIITTCFNSSNVSFFNQWGSLRINKLIRKKLIFKYNLAAVAELVPHWGNHFWTVWKNLLNKPSFFWNLWTSNSRTMKTNDGMACPHEMYHRIFDGYSWCLKCSCLLSVSQFAFVLQDYSLQLSFQSRSGINPAHYIHFLCINFLLP